MSCIYGPHQFGNEDQGWVAHFLISTLTDQPITIDGNGHQVRDILYIDDLTDAFLLALQNIENIAGEAFNIGGGPRNSIRDRKSTRLNSSHVAISYAVFCLKKKNK